MIEELGRLRRELQDWVLEQVIPRIFVYTSTAASTALGDKDKVNSSDEGGQDKTQRPVTRILPFGFFGVPPDGLRIFGLKLGSSNVVFLGIAPQQKYGPSDAKNGEAGIYCKVPGTQVRADENGNVKADSGTPDGGSQGDVIVNGGTKAVAREGDNLTGSTALKTWAQAIEVAIVSLGGSPPNWTAGPGVSGALGTINQGADHFKG